jgi:tetratricopeptide (TPR) repeat protein
MMKSGALLTVALAMLVGQVAFAPTATAETKFIINGTPAGGSGSKFEISADQKLMLEAAKKVVSNDYKSAEALYDQAISINGSNMDAYLQRGIVRRELGNQAGAESDGRTVVALANSSLQLAPNDANLYHRRGMGLRLVRDFDNAKADISRAIQMSGQLSWKTDLQAIELERKAFR